MNRLSFSIDIKAAVSEIWKSLWDDLSYCTWSAVYFEGSFMEVEAWEIGAAVRFLSPDKSGIYSIIEEYEPNQLIKFKHKGLVKNGENLHIDDETKKWSGATEVYQIIKNSNHYCLTLELDVMDEHLEFMTNNTPKALNTIKSLAEQH